MSHCQCTWSFESKIQIILSCSIQIFDSSFQISFRSPISDIRKLSKLFIILTQNIADSCSLTFSLSVGPAILLQFSYSFHRKNLQSVLSTFALWPSSFGEDRRRHENLIACKYVPGAHNLFPDTSNNVLRCKQCFFRSFSLFQRCQFA